MAQSVGKRQMPSAAAPGMPMPTVAKQFFGAKAVIPVAPTIPLDSDWLRNQPAEPAQPLQQAPRQQKNSPLSRRQPASAYRHSLFNQISYESYCRVILFSIFHPARNLEHITAKRHVLRIPRSTPAISPGLLNLMPARFGIPPSAASRDLSIGKVTPNLIVRTGSSIPLHLGPLLRGNADILPGDRLFGGRQAHAGPL